MVLTIVGSMVNTTVASAIDNESTIEVDDDVLSEELVSKADQYVQIKDNSFYLTLEGKFKLTEEEQKLVMEAIESSNKDVSSVAKPLIIEGNHFYYKETINIGQGNDVDDPEISIMSEATSRARFKTGTSKLVFYWWGVDIYLSKNVVNYIGAGVSIAGIWIPHPLVSKGVSTLGVGIGMCPGGIVIRYNFIKGGIGTIFRLSGGATRGITGVWFQ